ncbi:hypothetical protein Hanom_Chr07g00635721 [Helianthus anomalus]
MKAKRSSHSRILLEVLRVYEAAGGLLLLAGSSSKEVTGDEEPSGSVPYKSVDMGCGFPLFRDANDEGVIRLSADALMQHFPVNRKSQCLIMYRRRRNRCCFVPPAGNQVTVAADGDNELTVDPSS